MLITAIRNLRVKESTLTVTIFSIIPVNQPLFPEKVVWFCAQKQQEKMKIDCASGKESNHSLSTFF
jgi:hypothetical protein